MSQPLAAERLFFGARAATPGTTCRSCGRPASMGCAALVETGEQDEMGKPIVLFTHYRWYCAEHWQALLLDGQGKAELTRR